MNFVKYITFFTFVLLGMTSLPVCSIRLLTIPGGPKVLLCGDYHNRFFLFSLDRLIESINSKPWKCPVSFFLEFDPAGLEVGQTVSPSYNRLIKEWGRPNKNVTISFIEPRGHVGDFIEATRRSLFELLASNIPRLAIDQFYPQHTTDQKNRAQLPSSTSRLDEWGTYVCGKRSTDVVQTHRNDLLIKDFLINMAQQRMMIVSLIEKYNDSQAKGIFEECLSYFDEAYERIKIDLGSFRADDSLIMSLITIFLRCKSNHEALERYDSWCKLYCKATDNNYFDVTIIDHMLSHKGSAPFCYYIGESHAKRIEELLKKYFACETTGKSFMEEVSPFVTLAKGEDCNALFPNILPPIMDTFYDGYSREGTTKCCDGCNEQFDSLQRCAKCMRVFYCSKSCQINHWQAVHKQQCKVYRALAEYAERAAQTSEKCAVTSGQ